METTEAELREIVGAVHGVSNNSSQVTTLSRSIRLENDLDHKMSQI